MRLKSACTITHAARCCNVIRRDSDCRDIARPAAGAIAANIIGQSVPSGAAAAGRNGTECSGSTKITIKDIARKAHVSIGTVDRVLHRRGRVAKTTFERVERIIREADYKPNQHARQLSLARHFSFAVIMPFLDEDGGYWYLPRNGMEKALAESVLSDVEIGYYHYDRYSVDSFDRACARAVEAEPDGILLAPVLSEAAARFVTEIDGRIPYVFFDARIDGTNELVFAGQDSRQSGLIAGKLMHLLVPRAGRVLVVRMGEADSHQTRRAEGFCAYYGLSSGDCCRSAGETGAGGPVRSAADTASSTRNGTRGTNLDIEVVTVTEHSSLEDQLNRVGRRIGPVDGYFVTNAGCHRVAELVNGPDAEKHTPLIGYDLIPENIRGLEEGRIDFILNQRPEQQGYRAFSAISRFVAGGERPHGEVAVPIDIVMKENVGYYAEGGR